MTRERQAEYLVSLTRELCKLPHEIEWAEFKVNDTEPKEIGEYISALSNSAALAGKAYAYLLWGVQDSDHTIVGTNFVPRAAKVGNEELENWLLRLLTPKINFCFFEVIVDGQQVVILEIDRAFRHPVQFSGQEFIRVGSYKKRLKDFPEKERELWRIFDHTPFENLVVAERVSDDEVLRLLEYPGYFELFERPLPENRVGILKALADDNLIKTCEAGGWSITNLGAILFARQLSNFHSLKRKAIRVIHYRGKDRMNSLKEWVGNKGYAIDFNGLIEYINNLLPTNELIKQALRKIEPMYPSLAVRELVANTLIHQDFFVTGTSPMIEIFDDRIEITNPGAPLVDTNRFVDTPPKSRNEVLASLMRRIGICEERGSGWDKVVFQTEYYQLPAPLPESGKDYTRVILFAPRPFSQMDKEDKIWAVYLHACLRYVNRQYLTNTSVRERFGIEPQNIAVASRLIREAVDTGLVVPYDQNAAPKLMKYVPFWAAPGSKQGT